MAWSGLKIVLSLYPKAPRGGRVSSFFRGVDKRQCPQNKGRSNPRPPSSIVITIGAIEYCVGSCLWYRKVPHPHEVPTPLAFFSRATGASSGLGREGSPEPEPPSEATLQWKVVSCPPPKWARLKRLEKCLHDFWKKKNFSRPPDWLFFPHPVDRKLFTI